MEHTFTGDCYLSRARVILKSPFCTVIVSHVPAD